MIALLIAVIALPFAAALLLLGIRRWVCCSHQGWVLGGLMAASFTYTLSLLPQVQDGQALQYALPWIPQLGLSFSLYIDGLALLFMLLVTGMGTAIMVYAGYYFEDQDKAARFFQLMLIFTSSMLALVTAGNLITLFVAWELTSIMSFLLIGFKGNDAEARSGSLQALVITGAGGLALFGGLLLLGSAAGSMELSQVLANGDFLHNHPWYTVITILVMLGAFSKSAQFPLHFWLPGAMSAPTPASAYLHSATMVKAGIYLLLRLYPVLGDTPLWEGGLVWVGAATALVGAVLALFQMDLKGILAYSTISQLGSLVLLAGLPGGAGLKAAFVGILAHALYKGTLFLVVGTVDHATGTRNIRELGGLASKLPGLAVIAGVVALSMAGVPPLFGFIAKETLLEGIVSQPLLLGMILASATLTVAIAFRLVWDVFLRPPRLPLPLEEHQDHDFHHPLGDDAYDYSHVHSLPPGMLAGPAFLAALSVVFGFGAEPLLSPLLSAALGKSTRLYLLPPGGLNLVLGLSLSALAVGTLLFAIRRRWVRLPVSTGITGRQVYEWLIRLLEAAGDLLLKFQGGKIRYYLSVIMVSVVLLLGISMTTLNFRLPETWVQINSANDILKGVLLVIVLGATLASILFQQHLTAVLALGVAGYAIGGLFLLEPAPDVALVQFLIETMATVLIVLILARTSPEERRQGIRQVWAQTRHGLGRDLAIAAATGISVTIFALAAVTSRSDRETISGWYLQNANQVGVSDVVAGIITDFRGTDTLIEITVFSLAALGVLTMLARPKPSQLMRLFQRPGEDGARGEAKDALQEDSELPEAPVAGSKLKNPVTQLAANLVMPLAFLIAGTHILYGGSGPGDGFTAGVICGLGVALWYVVFGYAETERRLGWLHPAPIIGLGLVIAFANALLPLLFGRSFLVFSAIQDFNLAGIKLASPVVFEIGICLAVFGGISAIMEAISHPKEVEPL
jgi:multicomponent K+:H+ antiporter subunit A